MWARFVNSKKVSDSEDYMPGYSRYSEKDVSGSVRSVIRIEYERYFRTTLEACVSTSPRSNGREKAWRCNVVAETSRWTKVDKLPMPLARWQHAG